MGMPRKGSRTLEHKGHTYLWRARDRGSTSRRYGMSPTVMQITIQRDDPKPGRVMQIRLWVKSWDGVEPEQGGWLKASVKTSEVKQIIDIALEEGWNPDERGGAFMVKGPVELSDYSTSNSFDRSTFLSETPASWLSA